MCCACLYGPLTDRHWVLCVRGRAILTASANIADVRGQGTPVVEWGNGLPEDIGKPELSNFSPFRQRQSIVDVYAKVSDRIFNVGMAK